MQHQEDQDWDQATGLGCGRLENLTRGKHRLLTSYSLPQGGCNKRRARSPAAEPRKDSESLTRIQIRSKALPTGHNKDACVNCPYPGGHLGEESDQHILAFYESER